MKPLPHTYCVRITGKPTGYIQTSAENLPTIDVAPPADFGGPGDKWSPEELLMAAVADCVVLSFRAIARASRLNWISIECQSEGILDRVGHITRFTHITMHARLILAKGESKEKAAKLMEKAKKTCFVSNSLTAESHFECEVVFE